MNNIKVQHTRTLRIPTGSNVPPTYERLVADGELVLVGYDGKTQLISGPNYLKHSGGNYIEPIIISRIEKMEVGDWYMTERWIDKCTKISQGGVFIYSKTNYPSYRGECKKILVLPEQFSPQHLEDIVEGKLKPSKIAVECEEFGTNSEVFEYNRIKLNSNGYVTLHEIEEKMVPLSLVRKAFEFYKDIGESEITPTELENDWKDWYKEHVK